ncbi:RNA polymerase sigma-54 factor RpoN [Acidisarcina polymorpha]|uniref:RNA polymerase sigma factor n=1 Tax=Acidisarcina polymorpha TaxID=2211140 RepID=A0A2Z5G4S1_9BACT|nr:RNA polymerase sigma-54 factor RpoN [Acidisarcina polymorpha]
MAFCLLRNEADAEDVVQEAFLKSFQNLTKFRIESGFGTWLIGIVLNEARERSRKKKRTPMNSINEEIKASTSIATPVDQRGLPSQHFEQKETAALLSQAVFSLPESYREMFMLRMVEGWSVKDSAQILSIDLSTAKARLHTARRMLQGKSSTGSARISAVRRNSNTEPSLTAGSK